MTNINPYKTKTYNKEYYEYFALFLLKTTFQTRYADLQFIGGNAAPDLQDMKLNCGVEITAAIEKSKREQSFFIAKYLGANIMDIPNKVLSIMHTGESKYVCDKDGNTIFHFNLSDKTEKEKEERALNETKKRIKEKIEKLNSMHYTSFKKQELFVYMQKHLPQTSIELLCSAVDEMALSYQLHFDTIYFFSRSLLMETHMYECIMDENRIILHNVSKYYEDCENRAYKAAKM